MTDAVHPSLKNVVPVPLDRPMNAQERQFLFAGDLNALREIAHLSQHPIAPISITEKTA